MKPKVFVTKITKSLNDSIRDCFDQFGGVDNVIKGEVFIKINAAMPDLTAMTDIDVILETIKVVMEANPKPKKAYVFDSAAVGFPTRMVYMMEDLAKRIKKLGAIPLYLDEQKSVDIDFKGKALDYPIPIPKILYEKLIEHKDENTYINIPRLKTHLHTEFTACIKNQHGLIYDNEKIYKHHLMHEKIIEIYRKFKPDFNIVDATAVTNHGNFAFKDDWFVRFNMLLAGPDAVAVDTVCGKLLCIESDIVKYLRIAGQEGLGVSDYNEIEVLPNKAIIEENKKDLNYLIEKIPVEPAEGVRFIQGQDMCCIPGCRYLEFYTKYLTTGKKCEPLVTIVGKGHDTAALDKYPGPFLVNGPCSISELKDYFDKRKKADKKLKVYYVDEHFGLTESMMGVIKGAKLSMMGMTDMLQIPMSKMIMGFISAGIHGAKFKAMM